MGRHTNNRTGEATSVGLGSSGRKVLLLALGVTATLVAWGVLVYAAIDFGKEARSGEPVAWVLLTLATLGGAACLFVTLLLGARIWPLITGGARTATPAARPTSPAPPARPPGGHRAVRERDSRRRPGSSQRK